MSRVARVVIPDCPHHIIQRGSRRQIVFFSDEDRRFYLRLLREYADAAGITIWAYCLMDNHVHLIALPKYPDSFARGLSTVHWKYSLFINLRNEWKGHLWQARYLSYPLGESYLFAAIRYVELNPVRAGIVFKAEDYPWSSAHAHVLKTPDVILADGSLSSRISNWADFLTTAPSETEARLLRRHAASGRPLGDERFIQKLEELMGRAFVEKKRGRKPKLDEC
jgi:putative transposase